MYKAIVRGFKIENGIYIDDVYKKYTVSEIDSYHVVWLAKLDDDICVTDIEFEKIN